MQNNTKNGPKRVNWVPINTMGIWQIALGGLYVIRDINSGGDNSCWINGYRINLVRVVTLSGPEPQVSCHTSSQVDFVHS